MPDPTAQVALANARDRQDNAAMKAAQDELSALILFKDDMGAFDAHESMSKQALNSAAVQRGIKDILLNNAGLYESLRAPQA